MGNELIKIVIIEDEIETAEKFRLIVERFFYEEKINTKIDLFDNANLFLNNYTSDIDLIFMDINLPGINGMDAASKLRTIDNNVILIFTTSLEQYALKGYSVNAFDYLLKPVNFYTLALTLKRALPRLKDNEKYIVVTDNKRTINNIKISNIKYIEVDNHLLKIHLDGGQIIESYDSLKKYQEILKDNSFSLCNRCYLINLKYVSAIDKNDVIIDNEKLIISRPKRQEFLKALNNYFSGRK